MQERLAGVQATADKERATIARLTKDKKTTQAEHEALQVAIDEAKEMLAELTAVLAEKTAALEEVKKKGGKSARALDKVLKEIAACVRYYFPPKIRERCTDTSRYRTTRSRDWLQNDSPFTVAANSRSSNYR